VSRELVPLRIPSGWAVTFNIFVEFGEGEPITAWDADAYLSQDILAIQPVVFSGDRWVDERGGWLLDLSWDPPGDIEGEYVLCVLFGSWDDPTAVFQSRSWRAIQRAIDHTFHEIIAGRNIDELSESFRRLLGEETPAQGDR
jgi:hypothetical protein